MRTIRVPAALLVLVSLTACAADPARDGGSEPARTTSPAAEAAPHLTRLGQVEFFADTTIVAFPVRDLAASRAWYARVLGSKVVYEVAEQRWCEVTTPAQGTLIGLHEEAGANAGAANALGIGVTDIAVARAHLVANGVELENDVVVIPGVVKLLYFRDPDGNRMWFYAAAG